MSNDQTTPDSWRDAATRALFSGDWLVQDMYSIEGQPHETWSVKRIHTGHFVVFYKGKNQESTAIYCSLEALARGDLGDDESFFVPDDVAAQAHYALEAVELKRLREKLIQTVVTAYKDLQVTVSQQT